MDIEIGKWLLDISKYLITAMLLTTAFSDMSNPWIVLLKKGESKQNKKVNN